VATARSIATAFALIKSIKDSPKEIENLHKEHNSLNAAVESLGELVQSSKDEDNLNPTFANQVRTVIGDTQKTLNELETAILTLKPTGVGTGRRAALQIRCKYFWKERTIQSILARIQARRDALMLLLNMWSRFVFHI
jgi:hypothetical protein